MTKLNITFSELMNELDKYRSNKRQPLTKEQEQFLIKAREGQPVSWNDIAMLWQKAGWGKLGRSTLQERYSKLKK